MTERPVEIPDRIWRKINVSESGCWEWTGASTLGYGRVNWGDRNSSKLVHRVVFTLVNGSEPPEVLDHLCCNKICCNPAHLDPVTQRENIRRAGGFARAIAAQLAKDRCANGHLYTPETTYIPPASSRPQRQCRICRSEAKRRYNSRRVNA